MRILALTTLCLAACAHTPTDQDLAGARIHHDLGVANLNRGDGRAALKELLTAVTLDPELAQAHHALGLVYHGMSHPEEALTHYKKAIELKPGFSEAYNNLGVLYIDMGQYDDAIVAFNKALSDILYATPSHAEGNLGWAYYQKGDKARAERHVKNALAQNPKFCRGYEWLAKMALDDGRATDVVMSCDRFFRHCADDAELGAVIPKEYVYQMQYYLALAYLKQGNRDAAKRAFVSCAVAGSEGEYAQRCSQSLATLN